jgi:Fic family protein
VNNETIAKNNSNPFKKGFLSHFSLDFDLFKIQDSDIQRLDNKLNSFEKIFLDPNIEKTLISKNELLASFAISKAENSQLTLEEAEDIYKFVIENKDFDFISKKISSGKKLEKKDYEKLEFFNIASTFRALNANPFMIQELDDKLIRKIHFDITKGLDIFAKYLPEFTLYKSGNWRDNNEIRVGKYTPSDFKDIPNSISDLISWFKDNQSITNVAIFHTALYAIHPFNNGNKRVCRIIEHILLKIIGLNKNNLYSNSYFYHKEKTRYYKYLLSSLERRNLNIFSSFILESIVFSILGVIKTSLEIKRQQYIAQSELDKAVQKAIKGLIKRRELQFKNFYKIVKNQISKQTFVNYLEKAVSAGILIKRDAGKATYYRLNIETDEEKLLAELLEDIKGKVGVIDEDLRLV